MKPFITMPDFFTMIGCKVWEKRVISKVKKPKADFYADLDNQEEQSYKIMEDLKNGS